MNILWSVLGGMLIVFNAYGFYIFGIQKPEEIILLNENRIIDQHGFVLECDPPIQRNRKDADLKIYIEEDIEESSEDGMSFKLSGGSTATIEVKFLTRSGKTYFADRLWTFKRENQSMLDAHFINGIPKKEEIVKIIIKSTIEIHCTKVNWYCFNSP